MKDFNEEHIDPEKYWPEAESLLENHYRMKRRRRAIILFSAVLVGILSVYFLNIEKINFAEKRKAEKSVSVNNNAEQSNSPTPEKNERIIPSPVTQEKKMESSRMDKNPVVEVESGTTTASTENKGSLHKGNAQKPKVKSGSAIVFASTSIDKSSKPKSTKVVASENSINTETPLKFNNSPKLKVPTGKNQPDAGTSLPATKSDFADVDYIASMPLLKWEKQSYEEIMPYPENRPALHSKKKAKWDLLVYAGLNDVQKELSGKTSSSYMVRREKEEAPALLPFGGLQLSKSVNNWDFRGGFEFAVLGEQVKYSPYAKGDYLNQYDDWVPNNYVVTDTDSAYIWGILFLNTTDYTVFDSVLVTVTDTLNGTYYNPNIRNANGTNRWYVMELPLEVLYQYRMKRWGIGLSAGIAPGMVVQSSGYYLKEDESGYTSIKKYNKQQFTLNARAGIELSYLLNSQCRLLLRPTTQYSLLKMDAGANERQRYRRNGVSIGLMYMIP
jgi:hypothetical protein